ncbi:hypothetical protein [Bacillus solimangrovi]|uniref:GTP cyclohydrolase II domain-containing protein n=1 Tax=Bacillus solimangrovi TaxID=1305675 RepID=A0A1E5LJN1_9BACI|nr:hypothetical protein [Bacillus solimangrovi]OEH94285.1 hypothetical protein BFG57_08485 [Bacillus solimangrovi]
MVPGVSIKNVVKGRLMTVYGPFSLYCFSISNDFADGGKVTEHLALVKGEDFDPNQPTFCRINSACITSEVFNCQRCDCKWQLDKAMELISREGKGIITYHSTHEGRGHGLSLKLLSYNLMENGLDSAESYSKLGLGVADIRDFRATACILEYFNISKIKMLGNNKRKLEALSNCGIEVISRHPLVYNGTKKDIITYLSKKANEPDQELLKDNLVI